MNDKETGSFYTPKELIEYMVTYTSARIKPKTILEPSAGDGRFVEPLKKFKNNRTHLLNLNGLAHESFSKELVAYIAKGEEEKINERYKCKKRRRWYDVPIIKKGDVCFFKRYHIIP